MFETAKDAGAGPPQAETLLDLLLWRAERQPGVVGFTFLADGETEELSLTYGELARRARAVAARLQEVCRRGDRVLLLFDPGLEYLVGFFGCVLAGVVPVPAYPPDLLRADRVLPRLLAMAGDCQPAVVLGTAASLRSVGLAVGRDASPLTLLPIDGWAEWVGLPWSRPRVAAEDVALLQYTSGSTGTPCGVVVSNANLIYDLSRIHLRDVPGATVVSWLPMYHDLGLVAGTLCPLYSGRRLVFFSPLLFVQRPARWPIAMSRYRAATTGGPNFAYDLCAAKWDPRSAPDLDLSGWQIALSGAETIRPDTLARFTATFAPYGFRASAWTPCYGLAEATLGVSGNYDAATTQHATLAVSGPALERNLVVTADGGAESSRRLVGCGPVMPGTEARIVDPQTRLPAAPDAVGEIWVRGPGVALGYWNRPADTEATFGGRLADTGEGPFLRTGDLGFFHEGQLYLTGRIKELMIFRGRNVYPQDVERTVARSHPAFKPNRAAAFALEADGDERLVVVQEITRPDALDLDAVAGAVRHGVEAEHQLPVFGLALIRAGTLPKTSSGKIQRREARDRFQAGRLELVRSWTFAAPAAGAGAAGAGDGGLVLTRLAGPAEVAAPPVREPQAVQDWLVSRVAARCGLDAVHIDPDQPISHFVLDSVSLALLALELEEWLGRTLSPALLADSPSLAVLARRLVSPPEGPSPDIMNEGELDQELSRLLADPAPGASR